MRKLLLALFLSLLLSSCEDKEYEYANQTLVFLEDLIEDYEDAENVDSLNTIYQRAILTQKQIEKEQEQSKEEMIKDIELLDENAYLIHLRLLTAESHAQWIYYKRMKELEIEKK